MACSGTQTGSASGSSWCQTRLGQVVEEVLLADHDLVVPGAVALGHRAGKAELVGGRVAFDGHREGADRSVGQLGHQRHVQARVDAARQERAVRHVAHHAQADRLADQRFQSLDVLLGLRAAWPARRGRAAAASSVRAAAGRCRRRRSAGGRAAASARLRTACSGAGVAAKVRYSDSASSFRRGVMRRVAEQRLDLRAEQQRVGQRGEVQRLDADPVARQQQAPAAAVPQGEGEHAAQVVDAVGAVLLVQVQDDLAVARASESGGRALRGPGGGRRGCRSRR